MKLKGGIDIDSQVRKKPVQNRSIEKRNLILKASFELLLKNGFHNTTTDDIAKYAGVSTGIIYRYFPNKKELLICALKVQARELETNIFKLDNINISDDLRSILTTLLNRFERVHIKYSDIHEELQSLRHSDVDFANCWQDFENYIKDNIKKVLPDKVKNLPLLEERIDICYSQFEFYCHQLIKQENQSNMDFTKSVVIENCLNTFNIKF